MSALIYFFWWESLGLGSFSQDPRIQDLCFNISEIKVSITSLFSVQIMSYLGASDIIYSDVIDGLISVILKYESSVIESLTEKPYAALFTPFNVF